MDAIKNNKDLAQLFEQDTAHYFKGYHFENLLGKLSVTESIFDSAFMLRKDQSYFKFAELFFESDRNQINAEVRNIATDERYTVTNDGKGLWWLCEQLNTLRPKHCQMPLPPRFCITRVNYKMVLTLDRSGRRPPPTWLRKPG
ncbi:hypothetical protein [Pseudoalteromonas rubra]|uniref:Uncharacterized protein n=1 Tax=Pseudoalteromonas rubra TaxID=43658 RepID=A0A0U2X9E5_9GAMM|nr:hypothetical protein [Pseudoalteromonas rubra]ALU44500.1 hypothetical protein AT705_17125 [Pseudoalteromonas rubra]